MPRLMSFAMTAEQFIDESKTVTRRFGWKFLKPGDVIMGVVKSMGLKKGEKVKSLGMIKIISVRQEPLNAITQNDVIKEGFPDWYPKQFIQMMVDHYKIDPCSMVNRIEFKYL